MSDTATTTLDPKVSEFPSTEQADAHAEWLRQEIKARRNDCSTGIPHAQVMARMDALLSQFPLQKAA